MLNAPLCGLSGRGPAGPAGPLRGLLYRKDMQ